MLDRRECVSALLGARGDLLVVSGLGAPASRRVYVHRRWSVEQRLDDPPLLFHPVLAGEVRAVAHQRRMQQHLIRRGALAALLRELHVQLDLAGSGLVGALSVENRIESPGSTVRTGSSS